MHKEEVQDIIHIIAYLDNIELCAAIHSEYLNN